MTSLRRAHTALFALLSLALYVQCSGTTTTPGAGGTNCASLAPCCTSASLPETDQAQCLQIVGASVDSNCLATLSAYTTASYCGTSMTHLDAGGGTGDTGTGTATACTELATCCTSAGFIPSDVSACLADASTNNEATCASALASYHGAGVCTSVGTGPGSGVDSGAGPGIDSGTGPGIDSGTGPGIDSGTGGSCPSTCSADSDCSLTCPPQADVTYCCDGATHACYETSTFSCPVAVADAGIDTGVY